MFSFWQQDAFLRPADVVIVGAGFAGLWCAYELKTRQPSLQITILERESFPGGASVRNAGFACLGSPGEMLADAAAMGEEAMWQTVTMRYQGIQKLRQILGDTAIKYDPCGGYECFADVARFEPVQEKLHWLNAGMKATTDIAQAFTIADEQLQSLGLTGFQHLVVNQLEGGIHSGKTLQALLQKVTALGVNVLFGINVLKWELSHSGIIIQVNAQQLFTMKASRLIFATNAFTQQLIADAPVQPARGQVLMTAPIEGLRMKGTFHFEEGFYYWRNVGNRILLGGARNTSFATENTFDATASEPIQQALEAFLHRHIYSPEAVAIDYRWAGIMGFTETKKPFVFQHSPNVWAVVACNGMGVALTPIIAGIVAAQVLA